MKKFAFRRVLAVMLVLAMMASVIVLPAPAQAAAISDSYDGSQLWLNYYKASDKVLSGYEKAAAAIVVQNYDQNPTYRHQRNGSEWTPQRPNGAKETVVASTLEAARLELHRAFEGLLGKDVPYADSVTADGAVIVGTPETSGIIAGLGLGKDLEKVGNEGYIVRSVTVSGKKATVIAGNTEIGALYGTYAFIRLMQTQKSVENLNISDKPKVNHRRLNNWDTERLYAGTNATGEGGTNGEDGSIFNFSGGTKLPVILDRYIVFARMCASVGINEITINNVNAKEAYLSEDYILMEAALADVLRPYGVKIGLSVRYTSATNSACNTNADRNAGGPSQISGSDANNPYAANFQNWWTKKTEQIRSRIPDFIGYTVKANSEGQPGPQDYGYDHGDGANGLGQALAKVSGGEDMTLFWRTFVYNASVDTDRLKRAYIEFKPINDSETRSFGENVFVQTKNGPLDFQGREPIHPMFGMMDQTNQAIEVQITQEYTGHHVSLCYLAPMWEEVYKTDTYANGKGTLVGNVLDGSAQGQKDTAIVGVNNIGNSANMTGHHFGQANFFAFGRQAWDWTQTSEDIAEDWVRMTWSNDEDVVKTIVQIMMGSWEALVSYQTPFGVGHQMTGTGTHYYPNPAQIIENGGSIRDDWSPAYYSRVDGVGMGYNRSGHTELTSFGMQMGSNLAGQYSETLSALYDDMDTTPENLLLWFHHVPWDYKMESGRTFWEEMVYRTQMGVQYVSWMRQAWDSLEGKIDAGRFKAVSDKLYRQEIDSSEWRDYYNGYFQANNGLEMPVDDGPLSISITLGSGANAKTYQGFNLSVDSFNKTATGNISGDSRYNSAGGSIADASGSPFNSLFVPVAKSYNIYVPEGVDHKITAVNFLSSEGKNESYEIVSNTDSKAVVKVTREGFFGPLLKTYTFNFVTDTQLTGLAANGQTITGFSPDKTSYSIEVSGEKIPEITATASDPAATVTVDQATAVPGKATVVVANGSKKTTYTIQVVKKAAFAEDFSEATLGSDWSWVRENASNWKIDGGALTITGTSGEIKGNSTDAKNILVRSVGNGDWDAVTKMKLSGVPASGQQGGLLVYQDDNNFIRVSLEYKAGSGWGGAAYVRAVGGIETNGSYKDLFYDALETSQNLKASGNTVLFQISKRGNTYRMGFAMADEVGFRNLGTTTASFSDPKIGVMVAGNNYRAAIDSVTVTDSNVAISDDAHTHSYTAVVTAPTCTSKGYTTHTCACGDSYVDSYVDMIDHTWGGWTVTKPATATEEGEKTCKCSVCGETKTEKIPVVTAPAKEFVDVKKGAFYYDSVYWAVGENITAGTDATHFSPDANCTRGQAVTFLWRAAGSPEVEGVENPFVDVKESDFYYKAVLWAVKSGVTTGLDKTHFGPGSKLTRGQFVTFLWRAKGGEEITSDKEFADVPASKYCAKAVAWAVEKNITAGTDKTHFSPDAKCTRGQVVTFLSRAYN